MSEPLEGVLDAARGEAAVLRSHGHTTQAKSIEALADRVADSMRAYLSMMSDAEASLRSGWTVERLRGRFAEWEAAGFAMLDTRGKRRYRECIVPTRDEKSAARLAGSRGDSLRAKKVSHG